MEHIDWKKVEDYVKDLYLIADELEEMTGRKFTPDGIMVGSIGEVHAAYAYGVELYTAGTTLHDGRVGSHEVQVKITKGDRVNLNAAYDRLLVFRREKESGDIETVYNGDGARVWQRLLDDGIQTSSLGTKVCMLNKLRKINEEVLEEDRLPRIR